MKFIAGIILTALWLPLAGCSVYQATTGEKAPQSRDFSVLKKGTHRHSILAEFGKPLVTESNEEGEKLDIFKFQQGQHGIVKGGKAIAYSAAALATFGLSEFIFFPLESAAGGGAEMQISIVYDKNDIVKEIKLLEDGRWFRIQEIDGER